MIDLGEQDRVVRRRRSRPGRSAPTTRRSTTSLEARRLEPLLQQIEHRAVDVGRDDLAVRCHRACEMHGQEARAGADVGDARARPDRRAPRRPSRACARHRTAPARARVLGDGRLPRPTASPSALLRPQLATSASTESTNARAARQVSRSQTRRPLQSPSDVDVTARGPSGVPNTPEIVMPLANVRDRAARRAWRSRRRSTPSRYCAVFCAVVRRRLALGIEALGRCRSRSMPPNQPDLQVTGAVDVHGVRVARRAVRPAALAAAGPSSCRRES